MRIRNRFILFATIIHGIMAMMAFFLLRYNTTLFIVSEALIIGSVIFSISLYKAFVQPLNILAAGIESLKEKDFSVKFVKMGNYELDQLIDVYNAMIDQLREERIGMNEQHHFLDKLIQASPSGILILDYDNKLQAVNPAAINYLGMRAEVLIGKTFQEIPHPLSESLAKLSLRESCIIRGIGSQQFKCHKANFIHKGFYQHFIIMEELTAEILRTEKKAYEKVIRMMSHEVNNSIGAINSLLQSLAAFHKEEDDFQQAIEVAIDRNIRLAKFMSNFSDVVKIQEPALELVDVNKVLENMILLMESECKKQQVALSLALHPKPVLIKLDMVQMEQVLVNVLKNAIEAAGKNGQVQIVLNEKGLSILDNGKGIKPEVAPKLFSPFFSTKPQGQGIGLMLVREILGNHQFDFFLQTRPDGWTEFYIGWDKEERISRRLS